MYYLYYILYIVLLRMLKQFVARMKQKVEVGVRERGLVCTLVFPLARLTMNRAHFIAGASSCV